MQAFRYTLQPLSAFGTPLAGDTMFGQLCWALRYQLGNERLNALLEGYTNSQPFAVISDALPTSHVPLPSVPSNLWQKTPASKRKEFKKKKWLPLNALDLPFAKWQSQAKTDGEVAKKTERAQPHNTINRQTGTTGDGQFAPYVIPQTWFSSAMHFDLHVVFDETRITQAELTQAFETIGKTGFGRDASIGLGKFERIGDVANVVWPLNANANSYLTLGPCAPQGLGYCPVRSTYQVTTRFGRHGDIAVQLGQPFKRPVLLAKAGSVFWPEQLEPSCLFIGQGLGGMAHPISLVMPETVQQGYAPVIAIYRTVEAAE